MTGLMLIPLDDSRWEILARYNAEVARGIVHTDEWREQMAQLQREFDAEQRRKLTAEGFRELPNGRGWIGFTPAPRRWWWPWQRSTARIDIDDLVERMRSQQ